MASQHFDYTPNFPLEAGGSLPGITVAYQTWGKLNRKADNVVWICHALTANADAEQWWPGMIGQGLLLDPDRHFIVCANILGSSYGTTGPTSINPQTGKPYGRSFPLITVRDMVQAHRLLAQHLGIRSVDLLLGGSLGGHQALEWAVTEPGFIRHLALIATSARHSAWGIAFNEAQRMALDLGEGGLQVARAIAMLSYRNYDMYTGTQTDDDERLDDFKASSYQRYQGQKLSQRFDADSYYVLSKAMDSHHIGRGRGSLEEVLEGVEAQTLVIGISSDLLFPLQEQQLIAAHIPGSSYYTIDSPYGHDGFLIETAQVSQLIKENLWHEPVAITEQYQTSIDNG